MVGSSAAVSCDESEAAGSEDLEATLVTRAEPGYRAGGTEQGYIFTDERKFFSDL